MAQIRVSVANLAVWLSTENVVRQWFGVPNPKRFAKGETLIQALGGGVMLTEVGKARLEELGARNFEFDEKAGFYDARFHIDDSRFEGVFSILREPNRELEKDPLLDIEHELTDPNEYPGHGPILDPTVLPGIILRYVNTVRQKPAEDGAGTSVRAADAGVPTRRFFRRYELVVPRDVYDKMLATDLVRILRPSEVETTRGGASKGRTEMGETIADNIFIAGYV